MVEKRHDMEMPPKKPRLGFEWQSPTVFVVRGKHTGFFEVVPGMTGGGPAISGLVGREKARLVGPGFIKIPNTIALSAILACHFHLHELRR